MPLPDRSASIAGHRRPTRAPVRRLALAAVLLSLAAVAIGNWPGAATGDRTIVFIHVPAAWLSLALYGAAIGSAGLALSSVEAPPQYLGSIAPVGAAAAFLALWTGLTSQQGPGWWGWDARLVCELVLLLLFLGIVALRRAVDEPQRAERAAAVLVLVGALNIPMIYLSVDWWQALHERAAATVDRSPAALAVMVVMTLAFCAYAAAVVLARLEAAARERGAGAHELESVRLGGGSAPAPAKEQQ